MNHDATSADINVQDIIAEFYEGNLHLLPEELVVSAAKTLLEEITEKAIKPACDIARKLVPYRDDVYCYIDTAITLDLQRKSIALPLIGATLQDDANLSQLRQNLYLYWDSIAMDPKLALFSKEERAKLGNLLETMRIHLAANLAAESLAEAIFRLLAAGSEGVYIRAIVSVTALCREIEDWRSGETILDAVGSYLPPDFDPAAFLFDVKQLLMSTTFPLKHLKSPQEDDEEDTIFTISI